VTAVEDRSTDVAPVLVRATNVSRRFGDRTVLDDVSIEIARGEVVTMLGRSGAGKSTFLRILGGFDPDAEGTVTVPERRAIVFQSPRLMPWKKVLANVVFGLRTPDRTDRGHQALAEVGLTAREKAWPGTLSGGEAQRVALARAFVREPELLLLDEPFGALDALTRLKMHELVVNLLRRHRPATLLVTHDVDEAIVLSDRVVVLSDGRISADVRIDTARPRQRDSAEFLLLRRQLLTELGVSPASI
jgi:sulfonate transport system ATP-binding protein